VAKLIKLFGVIYATVSINSQNLCKYANSGANYAKKFTKCQFHKTFFGVGYATIGIPSVKILGCTLIVV
jgi:hypothetical protein